MDTDYAAINAQGRLNCSLYDECFKRMNEKLKASGFDPSPCISPVACSVCPDRNKTLEEVMNK